jgi:acyl-CoA thioesterase I
MRTSFSSPQSMKFLLPLLILLFTFGTTVAQQAGPVPLKVIVFGDSITAGNMLPKDQRSQVWVNLVEQQSQGKLQMVNEGKGGRLTNSLAEFKAMLARQSQAGFLVIALGMNDSRDIKADCVPHAVSHIQTMIELARAAYGKIPILLVGPTNIRKDALGPTRSLGDQREAKLQELGTAFAALAAQTGCDFVNLYGTVPEASLTKDGVHPDSAGNQAIAGVILPKLLSDAKSPALPAP